MYDTIKNIKQLIEDGNLSFIIGAGFSRNIYKKYPLWKDLLYPMIGEMYPETKRGKDKKDNLISKKGYLGIASEYVRRKGYHEAIDVYIEEHTPYLRKEDNTYKLMLKGECIDPNPKTRCHEKLLSLNMANLYVFNYDNTLDIIGETDKAEKLRDNQYKAETKIKLLQQIQQKYEDYNSSLNEYGNVSGLPEISNLTEANINQDFEKFKGKIKECKNSLIDSLDIFKENSNLNIKKSIEDDISELNQEIDKNMQIVEEIKYKLRSIYQLITNGYQISLTEQHKNIYKLHGNLPIGTKDFGFDEDKNKQCIITKEDYKEYPSKHEPFVNLMKIALLKGSFCLIGFSCDDPNFLMWMNWVKDVLDKNPEKKKYI